MLIASGNINRPYEVLGMVHATVARPNAQSGCSGQGGLPVQQAYEEAGKAPYAAATASGGDGVIHVGFEHRVASTQVGRNQTAPTVEVYGRGTAVRLKTQT